MLASNGGSCRRSTRIFFEKFSRLAEQLQNIQPEYAITYEEQMAYNIGRLPKLKGGQIWNHKKIF